MRDANGLRFRRGGDEGVIGRRAGVAFALLLLLLLLFGERKEVFAFLFLFLLLVEVEFEVFDKGSRRSEGGGGSRGYVNGFLVPMRPID